MRSARLIGPAHHVLGAVALVAERDAAISMSRGGFRKTYAYTDPNEDAACFALGEHGSFAAVADGHYGARGAERAIDWLLRERASEWTGAATLDEDWSDLASDALQCVHREIHRQAEELGVAAAPTTLSFALVRAREGRLLHASIGDSHVFLVSDSHEARDLAWATTGQRRCAFAGEQYPSEDLEDSQWVIGSEALDDATAVVLASDGLSELKIGVEDPAAAAAAGVEHARSFKPTRRPLEACRHVSESALAAHRANQAGDNMCAAVIWIPGSRSDDE